MLPSILDSLKSICCSPNATKFIEDALFCSGPLALAYSDPDQKWIIRDHLTFLFQDYPFLAPTVGGFTHNDGVEVKLLCAEGDLPVPHFAPPVPLKIWVHELYPRMAPNVFVNLGNSVYPIYENNPFVDSSGTTMCSYLRNWQFPNSNLSDLVHNLMKLFSHNHPFFYSNLCNYSHPSTASRMEAMDRLSGAIYYDMEEALGEIGEEIRNLAAVQVKLGERGEELEVMIGGLKREREELKLRIKKVSDESDKVLNWLKVYENCSPVMAIDDAFEAEDEQSEMREEWCAADQALEDVMFALDKSVEAGAMDFQVYLKQIRVLAREQFRHRRWSTNMDSINCFSSAPTILK